MLWTKTPKNMINVGEIGQILRVVCEVGNFRIRFLSIKRLVSYNDGVKLHILSVSFDILSM